LPSKIKQLSFCRLACLPRNVSMKLYTDIFQDGVILRWEFVKLLYLCYGRLQTLSSHSPTKSSSSVDVTGGLFGRSSSCALRSLITWKQQNTRTLAQFSNSWICARNNMAGIWLTTFMYKFDVTIINRSNTTAAGKVQSVKRLATGWTVRGVKSPVGARFSVPLPWPTQPPVEWVPGAKRPGRVADHPSPSRAKVVNGLVLIPPLCLHKHVMGWHWPNTHIFIK
jgi:hypothetical protein